MKPIQVQLSDPGLVSTSKPELVLNPYTGQAGVYSAVVPTEEDMPIFQSLCQTLGFEFVADKIHCTLMYSKEATLDDAIKAKTDIEKQFWALVDHVESWEGHDGATYVVAGLVSPSISLEHARLRRLGAVHSFTPFKAHVTLSSKATMNDELKAKIEAINRDLALNPRQAYFFNQKIADVKQ